ncbi:phosphoenolpyruvate hydrolase family protein [Lentzea alba]|uniref:phosphoenolpyruvate hydrolase family protein n=1 Tax=Lentzea alba TaxID=2714351 RepID=UPI0039BF14C7
MPRFTRAQVLERLRAKATRGEAIIGGGAGTGLSAKCQEAGGIDLLTVFNSGRYRMAGRGSLAGLLAYGNANEVVVDMAGEILPVVARTPVLAGVNATDPFYSPDVFLPELARLGFCGVQNFPTVGLIDGNFRANLEATGMGYDVEVAMIATARSLDLVTAPYVFSARDAAAMAEAGADIVVCHLGLSVGGTIGATTAPSLDESVTSLQEWADAAHSVRDDVLVLCHGGPLAEPEDVAHVLKRTSGVHGFYGASSLERTPVETAITGQTRQFTSISTGLA